MANPIIQIEVINQDRFDIKLKGDKHSVVKMIVTAMETSPEIREAILVSAKEFLEKNKFNLHL